jgi:hypothetical protein
MAGEAIAMTMLITAGSRDQRTQRRWRAYARISPPRRGGGKLAEQDIKGAALG